VASRESLLRPTGRPPVSQAHATRHELRGMVTDLDGTLLDQSGRLTDRTIRALAGLRTRGVAIAAASARPLRLVHEALGTSVDLFDALIVSNGAYGVALPDQTTIVEACIPWKQAVELIAQLRDRWPACAVGWEVGTHFEYESAFADIARQQRVIRVLDGAPQVAPRTAVHQLVVTWPGVDASTMVEEVSGLVDEAIAVTESSGGVVELSARDADKARSVEHWARSRGFTSADVAALGDGANDVPMLRAAGYGIAMGNANDELKAIADAVTASNSEDGAAIAMEAILSRLPQR
jgi:Cof subfamily protein (haloacid dehalogenase superfamily)